MSIEYTFDMEHLLQGIYALDKKADTAVRALANTNAKSLESDAKEQARWTDRTGRARKSLYGYVDIIPDGYRIVLSHGVSYGFWLEKIQEGKYAIVEPLIRLSSPYIMRDFENLLEKMGY